MFAPLLTLALAITPLMATEPPKLECLSDVSIEGLWQGPTRPYIHNDDWLVGPLIILVGRHDDPDPDSTWGVWNEPEIKAYIEQHEISVIFLQDGEPGVRSEADRLPYSFGNGDRVHLRSASGEYRSGNWNMFQWPTSSPSPGEVLEWIEEPDQKQRERTAEFRVLSEEIDRNPSDIKLRYEAIALCESIGGYPPMTNSFVPGLLLYNQLWYEYENELIADDLTEDQFREMVLVRIRHGREMLDLFVHLMPRSFMSKSTDTWLDRTGIGNAAVFGQGIQTAQSIMIHKWSRLCKDLQVRMDLGTATDRDRFILHALTAEGDEWQELIEQYPADPR